MIGQMVRVLLPSQVQFSDPCHHGVFGIAYQIIFYHVWFELQGHSGNMWGFQPLLLSFVCLGCATLRRDTEPPIFGLC